MSGKGNSLTSVTCIALLVLCVHAASAQEVHPLRLFAGGGIGLPSGKLNDGASYGYIGTAGIAVRPAPQASPELALLLRAGYYQFPSSTDESGDASFRSGGIEVQLDRALHGQPNVFVVAGGGIARTEVESHTYISFATSVTGVEVTTPAYREDNPYLTAGVGLQVGWFIFETRLTNVFGTHTKNLTWLSFLLEISTK